MKLVVRIFLVALVTFCFSLAASAATFVVTVTVTAKRYHFIASTRVFSLGSNITNADFVANAPFSREIVELAPAVVKGKGLR